MLSNPSANMRPPTGGGGSLQTRPQESGSVQVPDLFSISCNHKTGLSALTAIVVTPGSLIQHNADLPHLEYAFQILRAEPDLLGLWAGTSANGPKLFPNAAVCYSASQ